MEPTVQQETHALPFEVVLDFIETADCHSKEQNSVNIQNFLATVAPT